MISIMAEDSAANDNLLDEQIYQKLRGIASQLMRQERQGHTLSATDLVHEAYVKLSESDVNTDNPGYIFVLARQMRRLLVDYGRRKSAVKHGAQMNQVHFTEGLQIAGHNVIDFTAISEAIDELESVSGRSAKIIELYYFIGIPREKIAGLLEISMSTYAREVHFAKAFIGDYLSQSSLGY
jgi:RNA polymerase sigma factor (TIGR02999 family)